MDGIQTVRREDGLSAFMFSGDGFKCGKAEEILRYFSSCGIDSRFISVSETGMTVVVSQKDAEKAWKTAKTLLCKR